jgi:hypothetical protein
MLPDTGGVPLLLPIAAQLLIAGLIAGGFSLSALIAVRRQHG